MNRLLNISTRRKDLDIAGEDWSAVSELLSVEAFDGVELYPVQGYDFAKIPVSIVTGIHLRFFVIVEPIWKGDREKLLDIFSNEETIRHFYGGTDKNAIIDTYRDQLRLAREFGCEYVVFHPTHCELEYLFDWRFPWTWQSTVDMSADLMNEVMRESSYEGQLLFENLWWPGNFRLDSAEEIERLLGRVRYPNTGVALDTGHMLNKNQAIRTEEEGIAYLLDSLRSLGDAVSTIKAVHLSCSLSAEYVKTSKSLEDPYAGAESFRDRFAVARRHAEQVDTHDAFESPDIAKLFEVIDPCHVIFEFAFSDINEWRRKIRAQRNALAEGGCRAFDAR